MIERYSLPEMAAVWSEEHRLAVWQEIEALVVEAWVAEGVAPAAAAAAVRAAPEVDRDAWKAREAETGHDLAAFVDVLAASAGPGGPWVHYGLTSSDVLDTALGVLLGDAGELLVARLAALFEVLKQRALEHRGTLMVGRTHGMWAEPTTFGLELAGWAFEVRRNLGRLRRATAGVAVGKVSGVVGTYAHVPPTVEAFVCERLGLAAEPAATQVVARDRHADFLSTLALVGAMLERFAVNLRHLQRSEIAEVSEAFGAAQKGSSAMPHKRNPIAAENITGLARLLRGYAAAGLEDVALWGERDISHSSVERVALPDACLVADFALERMTRLLDGLVVDAGRMAANLEAGRGQPYSQAVLLALVRVGRPRDEAYRLVQAAARRSAETGEHLRAVLAADPALGLDEATLDRCFDPAAHLARAQVVFTRLEAAGV
ncbi:MAG: adenylosuccinate lyase [Acidobacteria bacterium]|nr:adenylosuccinate lyase [Acidobacteriota bacterium]